MSEEVYDPDRELDEYPNLFEQECDKDDRHRALKIAIHYLGQAMGEYPSGPINRHGADERQYERLEEAHQLLTDAIMRRKGRIAVDIATKHTRNPNYDGPGQGPEGSTLPADEFGDN